MQSENNAKDPKSQKPCLYLRLKICFVTGKHGIEIQNTKRHETT